MSTSLRIICEMLTNRDICHTIDVENGFIVTKLPTKKYTNTIDDQAIKTVIKIENNGEFIRFIAPSLYRNSHSQHDFKICMHAIQGDKLIQCCFDESTDGIWIHINLFLGESPLSDRMLIKPLFCIVDIANAYNDAFLSAIKNGQFTFEGNSSDRIKLATLKRKFFDLPAENLNQFLNQLDGINTPATISENKKQVYLH